MTRPGFDEYRETADDIVSRPEFREEPPSIVARLLEWILDLLGAIVGPVAGGGGGYLVGYFVLAVALVLAGYFVWRFFPRSRIRLGAEGLGVERATTTRRGRAEWLAEAAAAEATGRWGAAVHARYHALIAGLADDDVLSADPSTTSGEHRAAYNAAAGARPLDRARFDRATDRYESVWFGGAPAAASHSRELAEADSALLEGRP